MVRKNSKRLPTVTNGLRFTHKHYVAACMLSQFNRSLLMAMHHRGGSGIKVDGGFRR